ncbi:MAG: VIT1/CCC1 transporter family protein, partial [Phycisphaerae bacterium]
MTDPQGVLAETADHITEARQRARIVFSGESHLGEVDDWRQAIIAARDGIILIWIFWIAMHGAGVTDAAGPILVCAGLGIAVHLGVASGIATRLRLHHYESELERERREIIDTPEHEREEVLALYAAKGFHEPLLTQIADTLCADDDRLLKVMMEEELGLFIQYINHPLLVG